VDAFLEVDLFFVVEVDLGVEVVEAGAVVVDVGVDTDAGVVEVEVEVEVEAESEAETGATESDVVVGATGVAEFVEVVEISPTPNCAKGFCLPIVASGVSVILESCKLAKAGSEKIESSNFIVLTLSNKVRKL
jgi:hypothetical protein